MADRDRIAFPRAFAHILAGKHQRSHPVLRGYSLEATRPCPSESRFVCRELFGMKGALGPESLPKRGDGVVGRGRVGPWENVREARDMQSVFCAASAALKHWS